MLALLAAACRAAAGVAPFALTFAAAAPAAAQTDRAVLLTLTTAQVPAVLGTLTTRVAWP